LCLSQGTRGTPSYTRKSSVASSQSCRRECRSPASERKRWCRRPAKQSVHCSTSFVGRSRLRAGSSEPMFLY